MGGKYAIPSAINVALVALCLCAGLPAAAQVPSLSRQYPPGSISRLEDLPQSKLRTQLEQLPLVARLRALSWLGGLHVTTFDFETLRPDPDGGLYYADPLPVNGIKSGAASGPVVSGAELPVSPFPATLLFHSRPGAANVLYLNFSGETVSGTAWNTVLGRSSIPAIAFDTDGDPANFSDSEQLVIRRVWQRIAEDYSPFDVDVTTERPAMFTTRTGQALITRNTDANGDPNPSSEAGGVAYTGVFGNVSYASYRPAWIYANNLLSNESYIAEAASHELGHNLGLTHDGKTDGTEYYGGHGSGETSWGPIMGTGYNQNVSQWSKGEYYLANNTQDDLAIIAAKLGYRPDDFGNTFSTATPLTITKGIEIISTTPETDPSNTNSANKGVLERNNDLDVFSFVTGAGSLSLNVSPAVMVAGTRGGNADLVAELYNSARVPVATNNPAESTAAMIQATVPEGLYYLVVHNSGAGTPLSASPSGYTAYASLGQYFISGTVQPSNLVIPPGAELQASEISQVDAGAKQFSVTYSDNAGINVSTLDDADLRVTGPRGYDRAARFVTVDATLNGTPRTATYAVDPPKSTPWTAADNGVYTVTIQTNAVGDTEGGFVPAGQLGQFVVNVPVPIYLASMETDPVWTLDPLWQYGTPNYGGLGPSAGATGSRFIGYNLSGNYENRLSPKYAMTPAINCYGSGPLTLRFRRWLRLRNGDSTVIQVSTNGGTWTDVFSTTRQILDNSWQEVQYALPAWAAGNANLRLRWGISSGPSQSDIGWNIDDVQLLAGGSLDTTPPVATLSVAPLTAAGAPVFSFNIAYQDQTAVSVASLGSSNVLVIGPGFTNYADFAGVDMATDGSPRNASYSLAAPGGIWDAADNGVYQVILQDSEVADVFDNRTPETVLGSFTVAIPVTQPALVVDPKFIQVPEGGVASFTVHLSEQPLEDITVNVLRSSGDPDLQVQTGQTLIFTKDNWVSPATVVIGAWPDADQENGTAFFECQASGMAPVTVIATEQDSTPISSCSLSAGANQPAWGYVTPSSGTFDPGTAVLLKATPYEDFRFIAWHGDLETAENPLNVTLTSNLSVTADFIEILTTNHPTPLWWLRSHGITNNFEAAVDATGANTYPIWQSYIAGLNPNEADSQLRLAIISSASGQQVFGWSSVPGRSYSLEVSTNGAGTFSPVVGATDLPADITSFTNAAPASSSSVFYRLSVRKAR